MEMYYETKIDGFNIQSVTQCKNKKHIMVGSVACRECEYFKSQSRMNQIIVCLYDFDKDQKQNIIELWEKFRSEFHDGECQEFSQSQVSILQQLDKAIMQGDE